MTHYKLALRVLEVVGELTLLTFCTLMLVRLNASMTHHKPALCVLEVVGELTLSTFCTWWGRGHELLLSICDSMGVLYYTSTVNV